MNRLVEKSKIKKDVIDLVETVTGLGCEELEQQGLGWIDSVILVGLIVEIEDRFQIRIPDDQLILENFVDLDSIVKLINNCITDANCNLDEDRRENE